jgi:hypothetical protein
MLVIGLVVERRKSVDGIEHMLVMVTPHRLVRVQRVVRRLADERKSDESCIDIMIAIAIVVKVVCDVLIELRVSNRIG